MQPFGKPSLRVLEVADCCWGLAENAGRGVRGVRSSSYCGNRISRGEMGPTSPGSASKHISSTVPAAGLCVSVCVCVYTLEVLEQ